MDWISYYLILIISVLLLQIVISDRVEDCRSENCTVNVPKDETSRSRVLSRRKRFLTFPDGSSLQLVFCLQTSAVIPIGDIFLYGNTAALAWALPTDPDFFHMLKENKVLRRGDTKEMVYFDEQGKMIAKVPYKRAPLVNPVFSKRSLDEQKQTFKERLKIKIDRMKMHEEQLNRDYLKRKHMTGRSIEFHRSSRLDLYERVEKLLTALGRDGRQCVLLKLCEAARSYPQGTFLQELLTIVFTLPKGNEFDEEYHRAYDKAHSAVKDCATLYPGCEVRRH